MSKYQDALIAELLEKDPSEQLTVEEETFKRYELTTDGLAGAILVENAEGDVTATFFEDEDELAEAWDELAEDDEEVED
jgi:hypothetical protein